MHVYVAVVTNFVFNVFVIFQVDQKGSEKKLGETFQATVHALESCLVGYAH